MADELVDASHVELALGGGVEEVARERQRLVRHVAIRRPLPRAMRHVRHADMCRSEPLRQELPQLTAEEPPFLDRLLTKTAHTKPNSEKISKRAAEKRQQKNGSSGNRPRPERTAAAGRIP